MPRSNLTQKVLREKLRGKLLLLNPKIHGTARLMQTNPLKIKSVSDLTQAALKRKAEHKLHLKPIRSTKRMQELNPLNRRTK